MPAAAAAPTSFRILTNQSGSLNRYADRTIDIRPDASVHVATERGMVNPLAILTFGELPIPQTLYHRTRQADPQLTPALRDATTALLRLGEQHGVTGIDIGDGAGTGGLFRMANDPYVAGAYCGGEPVTKVIGHDVQDQIGAAARAVVAALPK